MEKEILEREEKFHDEWANSVDPSSVQVDALETACTLPETRYIISHIGKDRIRGKKVLEIGCGCGEASVYFAKQGADVIATDLSQGMCDLTQKVARCHNVKLSTQGGVSCENLPFDTSAFDIVYAANVLHHVDIEKTLREIKRVLKPDGIFVCWDPIKYNPAINIYRRLASDVRTPDEHPVDRAYVKTIKQNFSHVQIKGFWFLTNIIFVKYYFIDKLNPGKIRYWKHIIDDADNLKKIYLPLEKIDSILLKLFPIFKWWCWNMVVIANNKQG